MNVLFIEPAFPTNQREFVRALASIGANVLGIGERPYDWIDDETKGWLGGYQQIASVTDEGALEWAAREAQSRMWIDRLEAELEAAARASGLADGAAAAIEEFIEGHEGFYDTLAIDGRIAHDFISHYFPNVLEAMRARWISPQIIATNRMDAPAYGEVKEMGRQVIEALGVGTAATHMEWFFGPKGLKFSEIGCRPPGVGQWDSYSAGNEFDLYREWALAVCHHRTDRAPSRRYACGIIALRPDRDGRIAGYEGADEMFRKHGDLVVGHHFPPPGTPTQPVEAGYMANAWMRLRHPDFDVLHGILNEIGERVQVRAH